MQWRLRLLREDGILLALVNPRNLEGDQSLVLAKRNLNQSKLPLSKTASQRASLSVRIGCWKISLETVCSISMPYTLLSDWDSQVPQPNILSDTLALDRLTLHRAPIRGETPTLSTPATVMRIYENLARSSVLFLKKRKISQMPDTRTSPLSLSAYGKLRVKMMQQKKPLQPRVLRYLRRS